jgi:hypothetical protein
MVIHCIIGHEHPNYAGQHLLCCNLVSWILYSCELRLRARGKLLSDVFGVKHTIREVEYRARCTLLGGFN